MYESEIWHFLDFNDTILFLEPLAKEVADFSWVAFDVSSPAVYFDRERRKRGRWGSRGVSLFTFHKTFPVSPAVAIRAYTHTQCPSHSKDHWHRVSVKMCSMRDSLRSALWWHLDTKYLVTFDLHNSWSCGLDHMWTVYYHLEYCFLKISITISYVWLELWRNQNTELKVENTVKQYK